jgi:hypothetical protein
LDIGQLLFVLTAIQQLFCLLSMTRVVDFCFSANTVNSGSNKLGSTIMTSTTLNQFYLEQEFDSVVFVFAYNSFCLNIVTLSVFKSTCAFKTASLELSYGKTILRQS